MRVVKKSLSELAWPRTFECPNCHSTLEIDISDIQRNSDYTGDFTSFFIDCPVCHEQPDTPKEWEGTISRLKRQFDSPFKD